MFTFRDGKGGELSSQASKMFYKLPGAVYIVACEQAPGAVGFRAR